jgi:hypothetical protein
MPDIDDNCLRFNNKTYDEYVEKVKSTKQLNLNKLAEEVMI